MLDHEQAAARIAAMKPVETSVVQLKRRIGDYETRVSISPPSENAKGPHRAIASIIFGRMIPAQLGWERNTKVSIKYDENSMYIYADPDGHWSLHPSAKKGSCLRVAVSLKGDMPFSKTRKLVPSTPVGWHRHGNGLIIDLPTLF